MAAHSGKPYAARLAEGLAVDELSQLGARLSGQLGDTEARITIDPGSGGELMLEVSYLVEGPAGSHAMTFGCPAIKSMSPGSA